MKNKDEDDIITDKGFNRLMAALAIHQRRKVVDILLRGNDTQSFTTQQYLDTYIKEINKGQACLMDLELARYHLEETLYDRVYESKVDLWTCVDDGRARYFTEGES